LQYDLKRSLRSDLFSKAQIARSAFEEVKRSHRLRRN
jgi:hypothetical protein